MAWLIAGKDRQKGVHLGTQSTSDWDLRGTLRLSNNHFGVLLCKKNDRKRKDG